MLHYSAVELTKHEPHPLYIVVVVVFMNLALSKADFRPAKKKELNTKCVRLHRANKRSGRSPYQCTKGVRQKRCISK